MKKFLLPVVMSAALLIGSLSMIGMAPPPPPPLNASQLCSLVLRDFHLSHGDCVSLISACNNKDQSAGSYAACYCKSLEAFSPEVFDYYYSNPGECITEINQSVQ